MEMIDLRIFPIGKIMIIVLILSSQPFSRRGFQNLSKSRIIDQILELFLSIACDAYFLDIAYGIT